MKYILIKSVLSLLLLSGAFWAGAQTAGIAGTILDINGAAMAGVTVKALDGGGGLAAQAVTDNDGNYLLSGLPTGATYTIRPEKTDDPLNGVTVLDAMLISAYLLGTQPLPSPYALLAGDVNNSGGLSTFDRVLLAKVILGYDNDPDLWNWRFYRDDIVFDDPANPFGGFSGGSPDIFLTDNVTGFGFTGVKPGDLDGSAAP